MSDLFTPEYLFQVVPILLFTGLLAGILAGLLGVGGGIVIVPVLFFLADKIGVANEVAMHVAVGTSLSTIIFTSISSASSHNKKGNVDKDLFKAWAPFILFGSITGGVLSNFFDSQILIAIFGTIALLVSINMLIGKQLIISKQPPKSVFSRGLIGVATGGFSALMGIGGGTLAVPILSMLSVPMHRAVGTSAAFGFLIALAGTLGFIWSGWNVEGRAPFSIGYVNIPAAILIFSVSVFFAPMGSKLANWLNVKHLRFAFGVFLGISAAKMLLG